ncbi:hypothetical protein BMF94_3760 [Rhodotorula taiwanensis]|uniref:Uncharacterized protein n=1 Tax=Rhodotorula taiwanensis TaxID=741276 RepID=A0A2S5B9H6_9BASI|nr:hypothetical protein BMF94_3760 [Rhodotorula taiwanensis]
MLARPGRAFQKRGAIRLEETDVCSTAGEKRVLPTSTRTATDTIDPGCSDLELLCESLLASAWILFCRGLIGIDREPADFTVYCRIVNALLAIPVVVGCAAAFAVMQDQPKSGWFGKVAPLICATGALALPWTLVISETSTLSPELRLLAFGGVGLVQLSLLLARSAAVDASDSAVTRKAVGTPSPQVADSYMLIVTDDV